MALTLRDHIRDYDATAARQATNVTVNADLLRIARSMKINLSRELEHRLIELVTEARRKQWLADNAEAIDAYNEHIEKTGVFSDGLRTF